MKIAKKILTVILVLLVGLLVSYNLYKFICTKILKQDIATIGGCTALEVVSGSMEPTLHIGDMIVINTKAKDYDVGDIVTFYDKEGSFVTHRIVSIDEEKMVTKGDNNNKLDEPTERDKIIGKYVFKIGRGKKIISALQSPLIIALVLVNGILFCIYVSIDKDGNIILDAEEKEYQEFQEYMSSKKEKK